MRPATMADGTPRTAPGAAPYAPGSDATVAALFDAALDLPEGERAAWLAARCGPDDALRLEVESLLAAHARRDGILDATGGAEAESLYRAALAETRAAHGDVHSRTVDARRDLGSALAEHGQAAAGEALLRASLATARRLHGPRHATVAYGLSALATAVAQRGRLREAERLTAQAIPVYAAVWGERHSTYAGALGSRALLLSRLGEHDAADRLHRQAIAIRAAVFGREARMVGVSETGLAEALVRRGRLNQAESVYVHALGIIRRYTTDAHVDARRVHAGLATAHAPSGRRREAAAHAALPR